MKISELLQEMPAPSPDVDVEGESEAAVPEHDRGEYDREGDMAQTQLHTICTASQDLLEMISAEDNLPEWVQSKLTLAQDYLTTIRDYLAAKKHGNEAE